MLIFLKRPPGRRSSYSRSTSKHSRRRSAVVTLWVVNASPVILLVRVGQLDLLQCLGPGVVIPQAAVLERQRRGPTDPAVQALAQTPWLASVDPGPIPAQVTTFGLGDGESAVLAYALANPGSGAIVDDQAARAAAAVLAIPHQGTLGVVLSAKARGIIPAARPVVEQLRQHGMYLADHVMNQALSQVGE
jgi:predicted nucleic acid-binding protein